MESLPQITKKCVICGKEMILPYTHGKQICCSEECKRLHWLQNHPEVKGVCLNCGKPLSYEQLRGGHKFCSQKCNLNYYIKLHPEHQIVAGRRGGAKTAQTHPENIKKAYEKLTTQMRRLNKRRHDEEVIKQANLLEQQGFAIIFKDIPNGIRPDIIAIKNGEIYLFDIKTKNGYKPLKIEAKIPVFPSLAPAK